MSTEKKGNIPANARKIICASKQNKKHHSHPHIEKTSNHLTLFNETCHHNVD